MKRTFNYIGLLGLFFTVGTSALNAQIKEEKLILDRKREPELRRIEKKKTEAQTDKDYLKEKESPSYSIVNVPPVSDFRPSPIEGSDISPRFDDYHSNNYFRIGYGNYSKFLVDGHISHMLQPDTQVGVDVHHLSTEGLKKEYRWDSKQQNTNLALYLTDYGTNGKLNINAEADINAYNYYGIYEPDAALQPIGDLKQSYNRFGVNAFYDFYSNNYLNDATVKTSFLNDHFGAKENAVDLGLNLGKHGLNIASGDSGIKLNADLSLRLQNVDTKFDILAKNQSKAFGISATPTVAFFKGEHSLKLGVRYDFVTLDNSSALADGGKRNHNKFSPIAELQLAASENLSFYGGAAGGFEFNSYAGFLKQNPYLLSDQMIRPTETKYRFFVGIKGDVERVFKYDVSAGFAKKNDMPFFLSSDHYNGDATTAHNAYDYLNTFQIVYDNGDVNDVKASLQYFPLENLALNGGLHYRSFKLEHFTAYYKPVIEGNIGANYSLFNRKLELGLDAIFVGSRKANAFTVDRLTETLYHVSDIAETTVPGYTDLNLSASFKVHKNFSIFALGNNLLGKSYEHYLGYKVLGAQVLGGVRLEF